MKIHDRTLPGIPCPDVMRRPNILEILKKRKTCISLLHVIGLIQQAGCNNPIQTPKRKKNLQAAKANLVSPNPVNNNQQQSEKDESKICESSAKLDLSSLNLELVDIWKSKTARNLFGFSQFERAKGKDRSIELRNTQEG